LKLKTLDSDKYAGLISCSVLGTLLDEVNVNFIATLATGTHQSNGGIGKISKLDRPQERAVRIVIYGLKDDRYTVGNMLSDAGIFLQQPSVTECDRDTEYCNPHYLVRPGSQMPRLDALSICTDTRNAAISDQLDEVNKHRFMQIFDTADGKEIRSHIRPSGRLASTLKE
jgi:hypothetical protein